jgi:hypothetical protein
MRSKCDWAARHVDEGNVRRMLRATRPSGPPVYPGAHARDHSRRRALLDAAIFCASYSWVKDVRRQPVGHGTHDGLHDTEAVALKDPDHVASKSGSRDCFQVFRR